MEFNPKHISDEMIADMVEYRTGVAGSSPILEKACIEYLIAKCRRRGSAGEEAVKHLDEVKKEMFL